MRILSGCGGCSLPLIDGIDGSTSPDASASGLFFALTLLGHAPVPGLVVVRGLDFVKGGAYTPPLSTHRSPEMMSERPRAWKRTAARLDGDGLLLCKCGWPWLHQQNVTIFERAEDEEQTTVIAQDGRAVQAIEFPSSELMNPSARRHGMLIGFWCESCHGESDNKKPHSQLAIYQHKGVTFVEWVE